MDKRQSLRKELRIKALLTVNGTGPMTVRTMDVGKYGMCLIGIVRPLTTGEEVHVAFEMAINGEIHNVAVNARVSHCMNTTSDGFKAGLQFLDLNSNGVTLLAQYIGP